MVNTSSQESFPHFSAAFWETLILITPTNKPSNIWQKALANYDYFVTFSAQHRKWQPKLL